MCQWIREGIVMRLSTTDNKLIITIESIVIWVNLKKNNETIRENSGDKVLLLRRDNRFLNDQKKINILIKLQTIFLLSLLSAC